MKKFEFSFLCDKNPYQMPENGTMRFCDSCKRNIHDLTSKTPAEILATTENGKKPCGFMFPWQIDQINEHLEQLNNSKSSPFKQALKIAALAGTPLIATNTVAQKTELNQLVIEKSVYEKNNKKIYTELKFLNKSGNLLIGFSVQVLVDEAVVTRSITNEDGKIFLEHNKFTGKQITIKIPELNFEKEILINDEGVCYIVNTDTDQLKANEKPVKIDLQFILRNNEKERPILFRKVKIELFDSTNKVIETIETSTNLGGYSLLNTGKLQNTEQIMFTIYTSKGRRTAYLSTKNIQQNQVNIIKVNKKYRRVYAGLYF